MSADDESLRELEAIPVDGMLLDEGRFLTGRGQVIMRLHAESASCHANHCVIHDPSIHGLRNMRTNWRDDRGIMERVCEHGVGHPDPDQMNYIRRTFGEKRAEVESVHGCDGCCARAHLDPDSPRALLG